jgi:hypothetical protein
MVNHSQQDMTQARIEKFSGEDGRTRRGNIVFEPFLQVGSVPRGRDAAVTCGRYPWNGISDFSPDSFDVFLSAYSWYAEM